MRHSTTVTIGPRTFRIGSDWRAPVDAVDALYRDYPAPASLIPDYTVRLEAAKFARRLIRPSVAICGDYTLPEAVPQSLAHGLISAEMAMNLQMALGERRFLLLHASSVEKGGKVLIMTGESGSGKSTLSALLASRGWRFMGDEFALIDPLTGDVCPFPRPISLKNEAIGVMRGMLPATRFGPLQADTAKGDICHLIPDDAAIAAMHNPAPPALILFPAYGLPCDIRPVGKSEAFVRLTQASTNYTALGEAGFDALARLVKNVPIGAIDYPDTDTALALVDELWAALP
ncbi:MAG: HprK-related kinase A [Pseudomonadota bacterium]